MLFNTPRAALAVLTILGAATAGRLSQYAKRGGYGAHVEARMLQKRSEDSYPEKNNFRFLNKATQR